MRAFLRAVRPLRAIFNIASLSKAVPNLGGGGAVFYFGDLSGGAGTARGRGNERGDAIEVSLVDQPCASVFASFRRDLAGYDVTMELGVA